MLLLVLVLLLAVSHRTHSTLSHSVSLSRLDPRAQAISPGTDFTYSVVHDPSFEWSDAALSFTPPGAEKAVVYEMHIPTFNQVNGQAGARSGGIVDSTPVLTHSLAFLFGVCYVLHQAPLQVQLNDCHTWLASESP